MLRFLLKYLEGRGFRKYDDKSTESFLKDLEDGFFPSEMQECYPEGVTFLVEDNRIGKSGTRVLSEIVVEVVNYFF